MTVFGFDVSHYQAFDGHFNDAKKQGYDYCMAKCTEGAGVWDKEYPTFRDQAKAAGLMFAAYHFLTHDNIAEQVNNLARHIGDTSIPVMLDVEANEATLGDAAAFRATARSKGLNVTLLYMPKWYWERVGSPNLSGWNVVSSSYPSSAHEHGSVLYHANGPGWQPYGGVTPTLWQFASTGEIDGYNGNVDLSAFNSGIASLRAAGLFKDYGGTTAPKPVPVAKPAPVVKVEPAPPGVRTPAQAIAAIEAAIRGNVNIGTGDCQKNAHEIYGIGGGFASAFLAWRGAKFKHGNLSIAPDGALVYFSGGKTLVQGLPAGHVAVKVGDSIYTPGGPANPDHWYRTTIADLEKGWPWHKVLGWTEDINGVRIPGLSPIRRDKPAPKPPKVRETRVQRFQRLYKADPTRAHVGILDRAGENGRTDVAPIVAEIEHQMDRLPTNGQRMRAIHREWADNLVVRLDLLYQAIHSGGRKGNVQLVRRAIVRALKTLPAK